jgi:hypothetical protein
MITFPQSSIPSNASDSTVTILITSNTVWNVSTSQAWLTIDHASDSNNDSLKITATANTVDSIRTAVITLFSADVGTVFIKVSQKASNSPRVSISTATVDLPNTSHTDAVYITSDTTWTVTKTSSTWLTISPMSGYNNGIVTIKVTTANVDTITRNATLSVSGTGVASQSVIVTQAAASSTSVGDNNDKRIPEKYSLSSNYPNPFNPTMKISFSIPQRSAVKLSVFNVLGSEVAVLVSGERMPGNYTVQWNAEKVSSGIYFCRMIAGGYSQTKKLVFSK